MWEMGKDPSPTRRIMADLVRLINDYSGGEGGEERNKFSASVRSVRAQRPLLRRKGHDSVTDLESKMTMRKVVICKYGLAETPRPLPAYIHITYSFRNRGKRSADLGSVPYCPSLCLL